MRISCLDILLCLNLLISTAFATPPLQLQGDIDAAFRSERVIFKGKVVAATELWTSGEEQISEEQAGAVMNSYFKHDDEHKKMFGVENSEPDAVAHRAAWEKTKLGTQFMNGLSGVRLITIKHEEPIKGDFSKLPKTFCVAWKRGFFLPCPHVAVPTKVGDEVVVFLRDGWDSAGTVLPERYFLLGSRSIVPTKVKQGSGAK